MKSPRVTTPKGGKFTNELLKPKLPDNFDNRMLQLELQIEKQKATTQDDITELVNLFT